jgi:hypothetical protein
LFIDDQAGAESWLVTERCVGVLRYASYLGAVLHEMAHKPLLAKLTNPCGRTYTATPYVVELCVRTLRERQED